MYSHDNWNEQTGCGDKELANGSAIGVVGFGWGWGFKATAVQAQWADDVPRINANGDFLATKVQRNRGYYQQIHSLIVDRDPKGLNYRNVDRSAINPPWMQYDAEI